MVNGQWLILFATMSLVNDSFITGRDVICPTMTEATGETFIDFWVVLVIFIFSLVFYNLFHQ